MKRTLLIIIILIIGSFYILTIREGTPWGDDFCQYISHAKNIVEHNPYDATGYIFNPYNTVVGPKAYPPIFPLLLAPIYYYFGINFTVMKLLEIFLFLLSLFFLSNLFSKTLSYLNNILLLLIVAFNPIIWDFKDNILSEIPYTFFSILTIWFFINYYQPEKDRLYQTLIGILLGTLIYFSYGTRSIGIIFMPSLFLYEVIRTRKLSFLSFIATITLSLYIICQNYFVHTESNYIDLLQYNIPYIIMILNNLYIYVRSISFISWQSYPILAIPLLIIINILVICGYLQRIMNSKNITIIEIYISLYMSFFIFVWPYSPGLRYLIPIYPFLIFYFLYALQHTKFFEKNIVKPTIYGLFIIAISIVYISNFREYNFYEIREGVTMNRTVDLFNFIKGHTEKDDNIIFFKPRALALFTGRKSSTLPKSPKGNYSVNVNKYIFFNRDVRQGLDINNSINNQFLQQIKSYMKEINAKYIILSRFDRDNIKGLVIGDSVHFSEIYANADFKVFKFSDEVTR